MGLLCDAWRGYVLIHIFFFRLTIFRPASGDSHQNRCNAGHICKPIAAFLFTIGNIVVWQFFPAAIFVDTNRNPSFVEERKFGVWLGVSWARLVMGEYFCFSAVCLYSYITFSAFPSLYNISTASPNTPTPP